MSGHLPSGNFYNPKWEMKRPRRSKTRRHGGRLLRLASEDTAAVAGVKLDYELECLF
jgi:hypothetical protein